ncbi:MAG: GNAT family N-acetyltransferase [Acidobacteriota bacterium]
MPAYRFCRPDNLPLLVEAVRTCYDPYIPPEIAGPPMTAERFRQEMKELDLWPSNSLVALAGETPVAVLTATKRADAVAVLRLGVREEERGQGHAKHLLTSLSQKLAVLGPERLVAEVPAGREAVFEASGYSAETTFQDLVLPPENTRTLPAELVIPVSVEDLAANDLLSFSPDAPWDRSELTLRQSTERLSGVAVASPARIEAWVLHDREGPAGATRVLAWGAADGAARDRWLGPLLGHLAAEAGAPVMLWRTAPEELPGGWPTGCGLRSGVRFTRYAARAKPL